DDRGPRPPGGSGRSRGSDRGQALSRPAGDPRRSRRFGEGSGGSSGFVARGRSAALRIAARVGAVRITRSFPPIRAALLVAVLSVAGGAAALAYVQTNLVDLGFPDIGVFQLGGNLVLRLEQGASFRIPDGSDITTLQASMQSWTDVPTSSATITEGARFNLASPIDAGAGLGNDGINRVYFAETDTFNHLSSAIAVSCFFVAG